MHTRVGWILTSGLALAVGTLGAACGDDGTDPPLGPDANPYVYSGPDEYCPGSEGCTGTGDGVLHVGAAMESIVPDLAQYDTEWTDEDGDFSFDSGEPYVDKNGNGKFDPLWIAGYGTGRPATGVHDDLSARAMAFRWNDVTVAIVILDTVGYFLEDGNAIRAHALLAGEDIDHVIVGATHVHQGIDTIGIWGRTELSRGVYDEYLTLTHDRAASAVKKAIDSMKPAHMHVVQKQTLNASGDGNTDEWVTDTRDPIIYDPTMTLVRFTEVSDATKTIGTLVNWSAHPEYAGSDNTLLTADISHLMRQGIEDAFGGTVVFVNGPLGGQVGPGNVEALRDDGTPFTGNSLEFSDTIGRRLGEFAVAALAETETFTTGLDLSYRTAPLFGTVENTAYHVAFNVGIIERELFGYDPTEQLAPGNYPWVESRATYLQIGPVATITAPGELHPELWIGGYDGSWSFGNEILPEPVNAPDLGQAPQPPYLRELMLENPGVQYAFVSGLSEDFLGYIVANFNYVLDPNTPYLQEAEGEHYEETNSIGPLVEEQLQHPMMELARWRSPSQ